MASEDESPDDAAPDRAVEPVACMACRGTGEVVSNLGGGRQLVQCPWCDGGGVRLPDHDAQARRRAVSPGAADANSATTADPDSEEPSPERGPDGDQAA